MSLKFSIVTPTLNHGGFIRDTIESVLNQDYDNFEHIIIDGGSTDNTLDILNEYKHLKWISEKDTGPANAINKGFRMATGDLFAWLNSDDYYEKNVFSPISQYFEKDLNIKFLYGNLTFIVGGPEEFSFEKTRRPSKDYFVHQNADYLRQPCTFFRKELFMKVNGLDEDIKIVFDYDLFIKMLKITEPHYIDQKIAYQRLYDTTLTKRNLTKQAFEIFKVSRKNGARIFDPIMYRSVIKKILFPYKF